MSTTSTAYVNGQIFTADHQNTWTDAFLVTDGRIGLVGSEDEVRAADPAAVVADLEGRMVMPGIHDAHTHLLLAGLRHTVECNITPLADADRVVVDLVTRCDDHDAQELDGWLVAGVLDPTPFPDMRPDRAFLDAAFPDRPVVIYDWSMHHVLANGRALELAGIDADSTEPEGGAFGRRSDGRDLTGELVEQARWPVQRAIPLYPAEVYRDALTWAMRRCNEFGITSAQESSATLPQLRALAQVDHAEGLTMHIAAHLVWREEGLGGASLAELDEIIEDRANLATEHVRTDFVKFWLDGAPLPPYFTASQMIDGEPDRSNILIPAGEMHSALCRFDSAGIKVKIHCAGEGAVRVALDAYEQMRLSNGPDGPQHEVAHASWISDADMPRFAALNIGAELSPAVWNDPHFAEILATGYRFATMREHRVPMTVGTDWVVTEKPNLFPAIEGMVLRGDESIELIEAVRAITINGARSVRRDAHSGSIEVGKSADFIVLDQNIFEVPTECIGRTQVLKTVFEGRTVFEKN